MKRFLGMKLSGGSQVPRGRRKFGQCLADLADKAIVILFLLVMVGSLGCCVFFYGEPYATTWRGRNYIPAFLLVPIGMMFLGGVWSAIEKTGQNFANDDGRNSGKYIKYVAVLLFVLQVLSVRNYCFKTGWDPETVGNVAGGLAHGEDVNWSSWYFSMYPNNICLASLFSFIYRFMHLLGLHSMEYAALLIISCIISSVTGILVFHILQYLTKQERPAWLGYVIYHLLVGMSPWVSIPYSDSFGLLFPALLLYLYLIRQQSRFEAVIWGMIGAIAVFGYRLKPQIVILFLAILIVKAIRFVRDRKLNKKALTGVILGIVLAEMLSAAVIAKFPVETNPESRYGIAHFFMMGLNPEKNGVWAGEDVDFSASFATVSERDLADLERAFDRVESMGITGLLTHGIRKTLINYYDGTFAWAVEGTFFRAVQEAPNLPLASLFRGLYYTSDYSETGIYHWTWSNFEQMLWMTILVLTVLSGLLGKDENILVIMLAVVGLTLFELLFEARARYLYIYAPLYVVLASCGFSSFYQRIGTRKI